MVGTSRWIRLVGGVVVVVALLTSCTKASGGGWIPSAVDPEEKATFSFNLKCKDTEEGPELSGHLQYKDQAAGVQVHGDVVPFPLVEAESCAELAELASDFGATSFFGTYRSQPKGEETGGFLVHVDDGGEGQEAEDWICVELIGGIEYLNCQPLGGGNIQVESSE